MDDHLDPEERQRAMRLRHRWLDYELEMRFGTASPETVLSAYADYVAVHETALQRRFIAKEGGKLLRGIGVKTGGGE